MKFLWPYVTPSETNPFFVETLPKSWILWLKEISKLGLFSNVRGVSESSQPKLSNEYWIFVIT